ncbi:MAG: threonine synthase [Candidatus Verstraetearchaeota archaeon]|nr:threonine synthase [Candidatus Verstraetearchaeota archaeon]
MLDSTIVCSGCGSVYPADKPINVCFKCGGALLYKYDFSRIGFGRDVFAGRFDSFWKYLEFTPLKSSSDIVSLGEPFTPIVNLDGDIAYGFHNVSFKDDGRLPTGTFKARGMALAVSVLRSLGVSKVAIPSAGNAAAALSAYGSRAGLEVYTFMPKDAPISTLRECVYMGARVYLVDGLINDCASIVSRLRDKYGWFDVSTNKQPYRFEGYKLMAYEISEQFDWDPPEAIIFPTGGGEGVIGLWKGFNELIELGWIERAPRLILVQSTGCMPLVKAFMDGAPEVSEAWPNANTIAAGLRVPKPYASYLILRAIRDSGGFALAVGDDEIIESMKILARRGFFICPEAAASHAALKHIANEGLFDPSDRILLYFTGSGLKYLDLYDLDVSKLPLLPRDASSLP